MAIERIIQTETLTKHWLCRLVLPGVSLLLVLVSQFLIFAYVPSERVMGAVQRILYFHVGSAMATYLMVGFLLIGSLFYLATKKRQWDLLAQSAASVAFLFASIVIVTGMIWGHAAWNTWWRWEPRLVSFLVLWLIFFSYLVLRQTLGNRERYRSFAAVLGIVAAVNIPIVIFSIKLLDQSLQLHPEVVANQGLRDSRYVLSLVLSNLALLSLSLWLLLVKLKNVVLADTSQSLMREFHGRRVEPMSPSPTEIRKAQTSFGVSR